MADMDLLARAVGNLVAHKLLPCPVAPQEVLESAVGLLETMADIQSHLYRNGLVVTSANPPNAGVPGGVGGGRSSIAASGSSCAAGGVAEAESGPSMPERTNMMHLFDLCTRHDEQEACNGQDEDSTQSVAALSALGGMSLRPVRAIASRMSLLGVAVPALLARVQDTFAAYVMEDAACATRAVPVASGIAANGASEVCFVLARIASLRADAAAAAAAVSASLPRARVACEMAGPQGLAMSLLPQLSVLVTASDARIRNGVRLILEGLSVELGLGG